MKKEIKALCLDCMVKLDEVLDLKEAGRDRFDKCQECGRKTIVKDFLLEARRKR